jgi:hypothetical protein
VDNPPLVELYNESGMISGGWKIGKWTRNLLKRTARQLLNPVQNWRRTGFRRL